MSTDDRRRWKRLAADLRLELQIVEPAGATRRVSAVGSHLSPEGIYVQVADPPPVGSKVTVSVAAEGAGDMTAEGEVTRREVLGDESEQPPGIGIRLEPSPAWRVLYAWLNR